MDGIEQVQVDALVVVPGLFDRMRVLVGGLESKLGAVRQVHDLSPLGGGWSIVHGETLWAAPF